MRYFSQLKTGIDYKYEKDLKTYPLRENSASKAASFKASTIELAAMFFFTWSWGSKPLPRILHAQLLSLATDPDPFSVHEANFR